MHWRNERSGFKEAGFDQVVFPDVPGLTGWASAVLDAARELEKTMKAHLQDDCSKPLPIYLCEFLPQKKCLPTVRYVYNYHDSVKSSKIDNGDEICVHR